MKRLSKWRLHGSIAVSNRMFLLRRRLKTSYGRTDGVSARWLRLLAALLSLGLFANYDLHLSVPWWILTILGTAIFYGLYTLLDWCVRKALGLLHTFSLSLAISLVLLFVLGLEWMEDGFAPGESPTWMGVLFLLLLIFAQWMLSKGYAAVFVNHKKNGRAMGLFLFGLLSTLGLLLLFLGEGFAHEKKEDLLAMLPKVESSWEEGSFPVEVVDYGPETTRPTKTVNLLPYVSYKGWNRTMRDAILGYDLGQTPLAGRVYLPVTEEKVPVLFFIHGNHIMTEESHLGYEELGRTLASHGIAMVSVDERMLNGFLGYGVGNENDARAILLLENVKALLTEEGIGDRFNQSHMAFGGHSRGGEAAAVACAFQHLQRLPEDGNRRLDLDFGVKTVLAVAPTSGQYLPGGHALALQDVDYLVLHGSHDADVNVFQGLEEYDRVNFSGKEHHFKSALYIGYANHGQFNARWGRYDKVSPYRWFLQTRDLLSGEDQRQILSRAAVKFLKASFEGEDFSQFLAHPAQELGVKTVCGALYEESGEKRIADFEEDADLLTTSLATVKTKGLSTWREGRIAYPIGSRSRDNHAVEVGWNAEGAYTLALKEPMDLRGGLSFAYGNLSDEKVDFSIKVTDASGQSTHVSLSKFDLGLPRLSVAMTKLQALTEDFEMQELAKTVRIPSSMLSGVDTKHVKEITFLFNRSKNGHIWIDEVGSLPPPTTIRAIKEV